MKKVLFTLTLLFAFTQAYTQEEKKESAPKGNWFKAGNFSFLLNQSAFSNWVSGGENTVSGSVLLNYDFNYKTEKWTWDNKVILGYGLSKIASQSLRKTDDKIEFNSVVGHKMGQYWFYSFFLNFKTQFAAGYDYGKTNYEHYPISDFFAPLYLTSGPAVTYKKSENFKVVLSPLSSKFTFLLGEVFQYNGDTGNFESNKDVTIYGIEPGKDLRYELGSYASLYHKAVLIKNVSLEHTLNLYSNYLDKPENVDLDYQLNIVMQINQYLSTNLGFHTIYDDNAYAGFQIKEVFGLGVNYKF